MSKLVVIRNKAIFEDYIRVLGESEPEFSLHFLAEHSIGALFDDEGLHTSFIFFVASPDDYVAEGGVTDPSLLSIKDPAAFDFARSCFESRCVTAVGRLGQSETEYLFEAYTFWQ